MNLELSHRVARIMNTKAVRNLTMKERSELAYEVDRANSFVDLSGKTMALVLKAEKERGLDGTGNK